MAITVKKITLWRAEVDDQPGTLAKTVEPAAQAGASLKVVMGYRHPTAAGKSAIEVFPITGKKLIAAAGAVGLTAAAIPTLLVEGDDKPGLGHAIAQAVGDAQVNMAFLIAQAVGKKFSAVIGFATDDDVKKAMPAIKKAAARRPKK